MQKAFNSGNIVVISHSEKDGDALAEAARRECIDYSNVVVEKPWGYEYLLFSNESVGVWVLFLQGGCGTSMHCHVNKKTSLVALEGNVRCSTLNGSHVRAPGECMRFEKGVFHQTSALLSSGAFVLEVESPPAKHDLVRIQDSYGRTGLGYEGPEHTRGTEGAKTVVLNGTDCQGAYERNFGDLMLTIVRLCSKDAMARINALADSDLVCLLHGRVHARDEVSLLSPGDCQSAGTLRENAYQWRPTSIMALISARRSREWRSKGTP